MKEPNYLKINWTIIKIIIVRDINKPPKEDARTLKQCVVMKKLLIEII